MLFQIVLRKEPCSSNYTIVINAALCGMTIIDCDISQVNDNTHQFQEEPYCPISDSYGDTNAIYHYDCVNYDDYNWPEGERCYQAY